MRKDPILTDSIYHVFNKTIEGKKVFDSNANCNKFLEALIFYRSSALTMRLSQYDKLIPKFKSVYQKQLEDKSNFRANIIAFCLMPTHFHLLLKQKVVKGVSTMLSNIENSFTKYFNIKNSRIGPLFVQSFKSVLIKSEEQLKHVCRYILLNPYSSGLLTNPQDLLSYPWSSFSEYIKNGQQTISEPEFVLQLFNNNEGRFKKFVLDNSDYQKTLEYCKYSLTFQV